MRILFLGNEYNPISIACLSALLDTKRHEVVAGTYAPQGASWLTTVRRSLQNAGPGFVIRKGGVLLTASLRRSARKIGIRPPGYASLDELIEDHSVEHVQMKNINLEPALNWVREARPQVIAVAAFSQILKAPVLGLAGVASINVHPSLLPRHRGPNPFYWALHHGEREAGVTVHHIDEGIDSGDIIMQEAMTIEETDDEASLRDRSAAIAGRLLVGAIDLLEKGNAPRTPQNPAMATYESHPPRGASRL